MLEELTGRKLDNSEINEELIEYLTSLVKKNLEWYKELPDAQNSTGSGGSS